METQFVEFTEAVGAWPVGHIEAMRSAVAQGYITAGQAKPSDAMAHMRVSLQADTSKRLDVFEERVLTTISKIGGGNGNGNGNGPTPKPPGSNSGVNFNTLANGDHPADETKNLCLADALRCIYLCQDRNVDTSVTTMARLRLRHYVDGLASYTMDPNSGQLVVQIERSIGDRGEGLETITRTGTDSVSGGPSYGFTLKPTYIDTPFAIASEQEVFASAVERIPVSSGNEVIWPALDQYNPPQIVGGVMQAAAFAGITLQYKGETVNRVASDALTNTITFKIADLTGMTTFSRNYIVDNYMGMDRIIVQRFGDAFAWIEDLVTMFGDGINKPEGFTNSPACIKITRNKGAGVAQIVYEDIVAMMSQLSSAVWRKARWLTNQTTMSQLLSIKDASGNRVFLPNAMVAQSDVPSLIKDTASDVTRNRPMGVMQGLPVFFSEKLPQLGGTGDLCLVAPSQYGLAQRSGLEVAVSDQAFWIQDEIGYRFKLRHDGKSLWRKPYIQADSPTNPSAGTKVSPFLILV
jgi:HK97 family phage major capsid protein